MIAAPEPFPSEYTDQTLEPARFLCIGTHHKTGTIWMRKVFRAISKDQNVPFMQCYRAAALSQAAETGPQIIVNWSSGFPRPLLDMGHARFLHIIRDPRDVLLSGMRYHRIAPLGNEKFLREERDEWGGKNYQDYLNALPDDQARLIFEMAHKHDKTVKDMMKWPFEYGIQTDQVADVRYEDLIEDKDCKIFRSILERFDIEGIDVDKATQSYWDHSLFGGLAKKDELEGHLAIHVASGKKAQWVTKLPREVAEIYAERYASALKILGYAENSDWVEECLPASEIAS